MMTNTATQIANLMMNNGKTAADMTHAVKVLGNGSMQQGFARIGSYFTKEAAIAAAKGLAKGRIQGGVVGVIGTVAAGGIIAYFVNKNKQKADHEEEGRKILQGMEEKASEDVEEFEENAEVAFSGGEPPENSEGEVRSSRKDGKEDQNQDG